MEHVEAVCRMQNYIKEHSQDEDFCVEKVCAAAGYSRRQADRLFKEYLGKTLHEYISAVCLTRGAVQLANTGQSVLEVALNSNFESHEGFTRSFARRFHVTPAQYRESRMPIPLFVPYPVSHYHILLENQEENCMEQEQKICMVTVTPQVRPKRKLIYLQSRTATDYLSYCREMGCEWNGLLDSIPEKYDTAVLLELPEFLVEEGFCKTAAGVEVPLDYDKPLQEHYKVAELEEVILLYFQTEPFEREEDFGIALRQAYAALSRFDFAGNGYEVVSDLAPSFNFGAETSKGAKIAVPVRRI